MILYTIVVTANRSPTLLLLLLFKDFFFRQYHYRWTHMDEVAQRKFYKMEIIWCKINDYWYFSIFLGVFMPGFERSLFTLATASRLHRIDSSGALFRINELSKNPPLSTEINYIYYLLLLLFLLTLPRCNLLSNARKTTRI